MIETIIHAVINTAPFIVTRSGIMDKRSDRRHDDARKIVIAIACEYDMTLKAIGKALNGRDHTTVIAARDKTYVLEQSPGTAQWLTNARESVRRTFVTDRHTAYSRAACAYIAKHLTVGTVRAACASYTASERVAFRKILLTAIEAIEAVEHEAMNQFELNGVMG